jgi:hypothetical protein
MRIERVTLKAADDRYVAICAQGPMDDCNKLILLIQSNFIEAVITRMLSKQEFVQFSNFKEMVSGLHNGKMSFPI